MIKLFEKEYDEESMLDMAGDVVIALLDEYNPKIREIPCDEYGIRKGTFKVQITWEDE